MDKVPLFYHEKYGEYSFGKFHPFNPNRFQTFVEEIQKEDKMNSEVEIMESPIVEDEILETVHKTEYIRKVEEMEKTGGSLTMDTPVKKGTPDAARRIVGGSLQAAKMIDERDFSINLGGLHHAGPDYGEGFCIFNDVAVATQFLLDQGKDVVVFDTDAHQGNGTMDIFEKHPRVLFISIHQDPATLYPGKGYVQEIGENEGRGYKINIPMPRDANIADYHHAIEEIVRPVVGQFSPDVFIRNGGSDPHHADSLTDLALDMRGLKYLGETSRKMAAKNGAGYIDLMLSGYGRRVVEGWKAITIGSLGVDVPVPSDQKIGDLDYDPKKEIVETAKKLKSILGDYWDF
ncbi:MAG: histone deacetylase family protein [Candidatus Thermoplasmatota archaeon]|nr:histone deacetylase family protein [Candidatus Thermoplasmatota archaeon]MBS3790242.1 histone deacetylase family protein [Candidatus Thermoplasmatota archaeon]